MRRRRHRGARWGLRIFSITAGSSMLAITGTAPPQCSEVSSGTSLCPTASRQSATVPIGCPADWSMSVRNTRLRREPLNCLVTVDEYPEHGHVLQRRDPLGLRRQSREARCGVVQRRARSSRRTGTGRRVPRSARLRDYGHQVQRVTSRGQGVDGRARPDGAGRRQRRAARGLGEMVALLPGLAGAPDPLVTESRGAVICDRCLRPARSRRGGFREP